MAENQVPDTKASLLAEMSAATEAQLEAALNGDHEAAEVAYRKNLDATKRMRKLAGIA